MFSFPITAAVCLLLVWQTVQTRSLRENMLCFAEDGDMKIFGSSPKKAPAPAEDGEQEAEEYMRHKLAGNIDTAKDLGKDL